ncbi:MAG: DUF192 domain-containing protein [Bacteroidetes bacterium]|nr:DUF192 domain-containing protein [Bacteroidota bacterium]
MQKNKTIIISIVVIVVLSLFFYFSNKKTDQAVSLSDFSYEKADILIEDVKIVADISDTSAKRGLGLSFRKSLKNNEGMYFVFDKPQVYAFWMKDMNFSIDIIWINEDNKIVDITKDLSPETYPNAFSPVSPARYVLEVPAGFSDENGINIGDEVIVSPIQ